VVSEPAATTNQWWADDQRVGRGQTLVGRVRRRRPAAPTTARRRHGRRTVAGRRRVGRRLQQQKLSKYLCRTVTIHLISNQDGLAMVEAIWHGEAMWLSPLIHHV